jgi:hypothetical protein
MSLKMFFKRLVGGPDKSPPRPDIKSINQLRNHIIGTDYVFKTPFGSRLLTYADYTASGRGLDFIEDYIKELLCLYANTHTEDDTTGRNIWPYCVVKNWLKPEEMPSLFIIL